jgi:hypothetical protein
MHETRSTVRLAEEAPFDVSTRGVTATLRRADIEEAARAGDGPAELLLEVRRGQGADVEAHALAVEWSRPDLDRLLREAETANEVTIAFDGDEMAAAIDAESDVEAHGLREKAIVLTVVAVSALSTGGVAQAHPTGGPAGGGAPATTIGGAVAGTLSDPAGSPATTIGGAGVSATAPVTAPVTSPATTIGGAGVSATAPVASPATTIGGAGPGEPVGVTPTVVSSTGATAPAQVQVRGEAAQRTTRITGGSSLPSGEDAVLVGAAGLAIAAAGFAAAGTRRKSVRPA